MFLDLCQSDFAGFFENNNLPRYSIGQIRRWIFARKTFDFGEMTDISKELRHKLSEHFGNVLNGKELTCRKSEDGTQKLLLEWLDGERTECVLLRDNRNHRTGCISTQVGCAMGCRFCASGMDGFVRNLSRGEILEQILRLNNLLPKEERLTHLVVMGIGESALNLGALLPALDEATAQDGLDLSVRRVTISTVGIIAGIRKLAENAVKNKKPYKLAVSLHAPNDELRSEIIPQNKHTGIEAVVKAAQEYFQTTGRRVTFEYTLIAGVNDQPLHVRQLAELLRHQTAIVNVIPLNPVPELPYRTPSAKTVQRFTEQLAAAGVQVKVRFRKGDKISAACGQLRRTYE
ncbi:putative dual-specificity RNA methyltransferase RlmN [Planctomycetales bacterium]|nr:putative dual-specificity RNA methyltransferase RlmN [Planctomycetales bacterium]